MMRWIFLLWFIWSAGVASAIDVYPPSEKDRERSTYSAAGKNGAIAAAHPLASAAGIAMMKQGGNVADAAVATSFVISVVRPHSTGIGGGGFLLYHDAKSGEVKVYDCRERAPLKATRDMYLDKNGEPIGFTYNGKSLENASVQGHLAAGTPGLVAGLVKFHQEHGTLPLQTVMQPAIDAAANGFPVYPSLGGALEYMKDTLATFEGSRAIFFKEGKILREGDTLVQKDLAETLRLIAEKGADGFYKGKVAEAILAEMYRGQGLITKEDLDTYEVKMREPVRGQYRGYEIVSMPPPSSGGIHIVQMANILSQFKLGEMSLHDPKRLHLVAEAMRRAFADRAKYLGDPDFVKVPVRGLTSLDYAKSLAKAIDADKASNSKAVGAGDPTAYESPSTTHLSVVDAAGNAVSSTQTINTWFGSGVVVQGTGVILNNEMDDFSKKPGVPNAFGLVGSEANAIAAKKTMLSSMSPTLVFDPKKKLHMVVGSPGGPRIINATFQTILGVIDHGLSLEDAVHAYRIHHQWLPDQIFVDEGMPVKVRKALESMGHAISERSSIGDVQAVMRTPSGWSAVSDTRSEGRPLAY